MQRDWVEVLGLVAGFIGAFAYLPQAVKILRERRARDVSLASYLMVLSGAVLWTIYGIYRGAPSIVLWNVVCIGIATLVLTLKLTIRPALEPPPAPSA